MPSARSIGARRLQEAGNASLPDDRIWSPSSSQAYREPLLKGHGGRTAPKPILSSTPRSFPFESGFEHAEGAECGTRELALLDRVAQRGEHRPRCGDEQLMLSFGVSAIHAGRSNSEAERRALLPLDLSMA
jgi:hypothetical protein